ncbi:MAG: hypothetical protein HN576_08925 [Bacteriovoracaceae bacterium]|jgi:hypothetical protein|nr:hypothetical protein [Bacteriovoracaceae bacterium]
MKRITYKLIPLIVLLCSVQGNSNSSVVISEKCSESFVGTVTDVLEVTPFSSNSTNSDKLKITFKVDQMKNGPFAFKKSIEVSKLSPLVFEKGESYIVELNGRSLCHSKKLEIAMN